jgi:hypothetical protein
LRSPAHLAALVAGDVQQLELADHRRGHIHLSARSSLGMPHPPSRTSISFGHSRMITFQ